MSLSTHVGSPVKAPKLKLKATGKGLSPQAKAKAANLKKLADGRAERQHLRTQAQRRSTRLGSVSGKELSSANLTAMCQVAIVRSGKSFTRIAEEQACSPQTISRLLYGKTKRVSAATMLAALAASDITLKMHEAH